MGNFKEKLLSLVDTGASRAMDLFDTMNETINSIDWDAQFNSLNEVKNSLVKRGNELLGEFNELMKQVKNNITDFEVTVPFDETLGEKFSYSVEGNKLTVEVTYKDETSERCNKTTVVIPENCDIDKLVTKKDTVRKTVTIIIPKIIVEPKKKEATEDKKGFKLSKMATPKKKVVKVEEEPHQAESKLLKKFHERTKASRVNTTAEQPTAMPRGANGRFVKRNKAN